MSASLRKITPIVVEMEFISAIHATDNRRGVNDGAVTRLMESIVRLGLRVPLAVRTVPEFDIPGEGLVSNVRLLVAGAHRLEACRRLGWEEVPVVEISDETDARLWEIAENLHRAELSVQERADHIAEWMRLTGERIVASCDSSKPGPKGVLRAAARDLGIGKDEASRSVRIAGITTEAREAADQAGLNTQAARLEIARAEPEHQVAKVTEMAASRTKPVPLPKNELETEDDWRNGMMRMWNRAPDGWRERFIDYVQSPVFDNTRSGAA